MKRHFLIFLICISPTLRAQELVTYENIRVEDFQEGQLFNFRIYFNEKYSSAPGRSVQSLLLKKIQYNGNSANPSVISGYSNERMVKGIRIEGLKINGKPILNATDGNIRIGDFTEGVKFK